MNKLLFALGLLVGCGNVTAPDKPDSGSVGGDGSGSGSGSGVADQGPHSHGFSAAGRRSQSAHFVLVSVTGQPTPVANRRSSSPQFVHVPGILGGQ
jgi:hypothetical protein